MSTYFRASIYKRFTKIIFLIMSGQAHMRTLILACSVLALLILAYVSTQIYAGKVEEKISKLKSDKVQIQQEVNELTVEYMSLSSRSKVIDYCEKKLGMIRADGGTVVRIAVEERRGSSPQVAGTKNGRMWVQANLALKSAELKVTRK